MIRRVFMLTLLVVFMGVAADYAGAAGVAAPKSTPQIQKAIASGKKTVVFFINPNGAPCRAQNEILQSLNKDRGGNFNIAYATTMEPADQKAFYDYGIRSLPSLVLVDGSGKISRHFPPGIQSYETLVKALDSIAAEGLLQHIEFVDLNNEFPISYWTPYLKNELFLLLLNGR